jgi:RTX calcium-binding nonapeptide repeat (4 copies)
LLTTPGYASTHNKKGPEHDHKEERITDAETSKPMTGQVRSVIPQTRKGKSRMTRAGNTQLGMRMALLLLAIIGSLVFSSGIALAATITCQTGVECLGTKNADTLNGTADKDYIYGRGGGDLLKGRGENDVLFGQGGNDELLGGGDSDDLAGGPGVDKLGGDGGADRYFFGDGWGKDSITDAATPGTEVHFFDLQKVAPATDDMIVDLESGAGPEAKDVSGTNTLNWGGNVIDGVFGGAGDDELTGNASANEILGGGGADTVYGSGGDDEIRVNDGSRADTVHCGPGDDTVFYDVILIGFTDTIDSDCEGLVAF